LKDSARHNKIQSLSKEIWMNTSSIASINLFSSRKIVNYF
jgi:hypothetical protein